MTTAPQVPVIKLRQLALCKPEAKPAWLRGALDVLLHVGDTLGDRGDTLGDRLHQLSGRPRTRKGALQKKTWNFEHNPAFPN